MASYPPKSKSKHTVTKPLKVYMRLYKDNKIFSACNWTLCIKYCNHKLYTSFLALKSRGNMKIAAILLVLSSSLDVSNGWQCGSTSSSWQLLDLTHDLNNDTVSGYFQLYTTFYGYKTTTDGDQYW